LVAISGSAVGQSTLQSPIGQIVPVWYDTGAWDNPTNQPVVVATVPVMVPNSSWLRAYLEESPLPVGSSVRFTSMTDGETQTLDTKGLTVWSNTSAYFNGDTLLMELIAGPHTFGNRVVVKRLGIDTGIRPVGSPGQCGIVGPDDRFPTAELWSGRIMPVGCSATVYCNTGGGMITAGHCLDGQSQLVMHFNVPASNGNCSTNAPPVADQFPVTNTQFVNGGVGNDWGVIRVGTNGGGQTPFVRYGVFRTLAAGPAANGTPTGIWGYGVDETCVRSQIQQFSGGNIASVQGAYYDIFNDVRGGNSGSGYLNAANQVIGVVTHCRFDGSSNISQRIDFPAFVAARAALNPCGAGSTPPANDNCGSAIAIGLGLTTGTTANATNDAAGTCGLSGASPDVWYSITLPCSGDYRIDTCGSGYDTVLGLYTACGGSVLSCNDDHGGQGCPNGLDSVINASLNAGTYLIRVSGFNNQSGNFNLNVSGTINAPSNDSCFVALPVSAGFVTGSTTCATNDGSANCAASGSSPDVWYSYTAPCTGTVVFDTLGSGYDTALSIHSGCPGLVGNQIACDDDGAGFPFSRINLAATGGTTYLIRVNGFANLTGNFRLNISSLGPANDNCGNAQDVSAGGSFGGTLLCATNDGTANCGASATNPDVWYSWTNTGCGPRRLDVNTCGSNASFGIDTVVSFYRACGGTQISCNDDSINICTPNAGTLDSALSTVVAPGATVKIRVSKFGSRIIAPFTLNVSSTLANNACADAVLVPDGTYAWCNSEATTDGPAACGALGRDVWFRHTALQTGTLTVSTCGSSFDSVVAVYPDGCPAGSSIACNDDDFNVNCPGGFIRDAWLRVPVTAGTTSLIRLGGFGVSTGVGQFTVTNTPAGNCPSQTFGCTADQDGDDDVDSDDVIQFFANFDGGDSCGDQDGDDDVDSDDINVFFSLFEQGGC